MSVAIRDTSYGKLEGEDCDGVLQWLGIPFAKAPIGELRFAPPQPPESWDGVRTAKQFGSRAPQPPDVFGTIAGLPEDPAEENEDCLYLNVWAPCGASIQDKLPVMVWIHGGAFRSGSASLPMYHGDVLARKHEVVAVSINYRIGALGFAVSNKLSIASNNGLRDQIAALKWISSEIHQFGGDADNVTIFGESAGGMSCTSLASSPQAKGLFHRIIAQSGAGSHVCAREFSENVVMEEWYKELNLAEVSLEALRELSVQDILKAQISASTNLSAKGHMLHFFPTIDDDLLVDLPSHAIHKGLGSNVPILTGFTLEEWKLFSRMFPIQLSKEKVVGMAAAAAGGSKEKGEALYHHYEKKLQSEGMDMDNDDAVAKAVMEYINSETVFRVPAVRLAEANSSSTYVYRFCWKSLNPDLGSCHAVDIPFVTGRLGSLEKFIDGDIEEMSAVMRSVWTSFARDGVPKLPDGSTFPKYEHDGRRTIVSFGDGNKADHYRAHDRLFDNDDVMWSDLLHPFPAK